MRGRLLISSLVWLSGCGGDDTATTESSDTLVSMTSAPTTASPTSTTVNTTETSGVASTSNGSTTTSSDGAPFFLSFSTNVGTITDGESVVFTATVSDPDGLDDIAGGTLFTGDGAFSYGPFVAAGQEGTYSITVSWDAIDQVEAVEFESIDAVRIFRAKFFDMKGNSASMDTSITLSCPGGGACDGVCKDFQVDAENCGSCGKICPGGCDNAMCSPAFGECISMPSGFVSCAEYCQGQGEECVENGCDGNTYKGYNSTPFCMKDDVPSGFFTTPCDKNNTWGPTEVVVRCCCTDST